MCVTIPSVNAESQLHTAIGRPIVSVPIDLDRLRKEMFRRGLTRREMAAAAGISDRTLAAVFATGMASEGTKMKLAVGLFGQPIVADPDLLESA